MSLGTLLLWLLPVAAVAFIVIHYRMRTRSRRAGSEARRQAMLRDVGMAGEKVTAVADLPATAASVTMAVESVARGNRMRDAILDRERALVYLLLKTSLPECHVFARVPFAEIVEPDAPVTGKASLLIDFVVCSGTFAPQVVVLLSESAHPVEILLRETGLRYVRWDPRNLPRRETVRVALGISESGTPAV